MALDRCPSGYTACGVTTSRRTIGMECIDTSNNIESCGGCVNPVMTAKKSKRKATTPVQASGQDCTAIPGVNEVNCYYGECQVQSCERGWVTAMDGKNCIRGIMEIQGGSKRGE
jgi:hypothetical protein